MDVKQAFLTAVKSLGLPVFLQGSLAENEPYPESFFTFWNNETFEKKSYDNKETFIEWDFDLNFYSTSPIAVNATLLDAKIALKRAGFIVGGAGYDVLSDEPTHTGRGTQVIYLERVLQNG